MSQAGEQKEGSEMSIVGVAVVLLRRRRIILLVMLVAVALAVAAGLLARRTYTASASFMPQASDKGLLRLAGLAAQFGVPTLGGGSGGQSPDFFASVITSRQLLGAVAETQLTIPQAARDSGSRTGTVADFLEIQESSPAIRQERAIDALRKRVGAVTDAKTGVVEVTARMPDPSLAEQVLKRMLDLLNEFNLRTRQSQARAERIFVEGRLAEVQGELRQAENRLQAFLQRNRDFFNSPQLKFEQERLQRDVSMRQQIYTTLAQTYEQSRIDEVRDTPVITVVEAAYRPVEPDSRRILVRVVLALLLGGMAGVLIAFFSEFAQGRREAGDATFHDLVVLRRQAAEDLKRPWRLLRPTADGR